MIDLSTRPDSWAYCSSGRDGSGRVACFTMVAAVALGALAAVVLLPAYGRLVEAEYHLACLQAGLADAEALIETNERLIRALPEDDVVPVRVARSQFGLLPELLPADEVVAVKTAADGRPASPAPLVQIRSSPPPARPHGALLTLAERLQSPARRRGLLVISACALALAVLLPARPADASPRRL